MTTSTNRASIGALLLSSRASASTPFAAVSAAKPRLLSMRTSAFRKFSSSSTMRISSPRPGTIRKPWASPPLPPLPPAPPAPPPSPARAVGGGLWAASMSRHPKGVRLTAAGAAFADGSRQLLRDLAGAHDRADTTAAGQRGRVVMAATRPAVARGFPTEVQESLRDDHPEVTVVVQDWEPP